MNTDWMHDGSCSDVDPSVFFPADGAGVARAREVCSECRVKSACLEFAIINGIAHGVWGGTSERQRMRLRSRRRLEALA